MRLQENNKFKRTNRFFFLFTFLFLIGFVSAFAQKQYVVVIDAGHGGKDPGNLGNGYKEKKIALRVALITGKKLAKKKEIKVIYTRKRDVFVDLWKRGEIANRAKADLFVSIHCDSQRSNAYGAGSFVLGLGGNKKNLEIAKRENAVILLEENYKKRYKGFDPYSAESVIGLSLLQEENLDKSLAIAGLIQNNFATKLKRHDRKVKQGNFQVLRETIMPSVLVELGFLTNKKEGRFLNSKKGQIHMGNSIALAIEHYISNLRLNTVGSKGARTKEKPTIEYKIQIASGKNRITTKSYNFKGLKGIERIKNGSHFRYFYGKTSVYSRIKKSLKIAKRKGYKTAFIVAFKDGKKISVKKAIKMD